MAKKRIVNSLGNVFTTDVAERISNQFDHAHDIRDTFTFRIMCGITGKSDDTVRAAIMLAMKKANSKKSNVKVRFTQEFANDHMEEFLQLAKTVQLENEARILEIRESLNDEDKANGRRIAFQNYANMIARGYLASSVKDSTIAAGLRATGDWYVPETAVFTLDLDFAGITEKNSGLNLEKQIEITSSDGTKYDAYRVITTVAGSKSCPVTVSNKDKMADMLYDIMIAYDRVFKNVDGADMEQLFEALKEFVSEYRIHSNTELVDTRLTEEEKKAAEEWANKAVNWLRNN